MTSLAGLRARLPSLRNSAFLKNVAHTLHGNVIGQVLVVVSLPFLARFFPPEAFALAQACTAVVAIGVIISCFRYEVALTICSDSEVKPLLTVVAIGGIVTPLVLAGGIILVPAGWFQALQLDALKPVAGWLALSILVASAGNALSYLTIRVHAFRQMALAKILQAVGFVGSGLLIGFFWPISTGVLIADTIGRTVLMLAIALWLMRFVSPDIVRTNWRDILGVVKRYRWFPLISLPGSLVSVLAASFNTVWMLALFSPHEAGSYALVERLVLAPAALIGTALQQVYQGQFSSALRNGGQGLKSGFRRLLAGLFALGILPSAALVFLAPILFPLVLGSQWSEAGRYCQIFVPIAFVSVLAVPFNMVLTLMQRHKLQLAWEVGRFLLVTAAWLTTTLVQLSASSALGLVSAATCLAYVGYLVLAYKEVSRLEARGGFDALPTRDADAPASEP